MSDHKELPYIVIERESGGGLGAFVLGALVGVSLGLLFAPKSGAETQEDLKEHARRLREAAEGRMRDVEDRLGVARDGAKEHIESVKNAVDAGVQAAREARDELEKKLETTKAAYRAGIDVARQPVPAGTDAEDVLEDVLEVMD